MPTPCLEIAVINLLTQNTLAYRTELNPGDTLSSVAEDAAKEFFPLLPKVWWQGSIALVEVLIIGKHYTRVGGSHSYSWRGDCTKQERFIFGVKHGAKMLDDYAQRVCGFAQSAGVQK
nr:hypothetical protein [Brucella intermedia]